MIKYIKSNLGADDYIPYFTFEELNKLGDYVADELTHAYRRFGIDFEADGAIESQIETEDFCTMNYAISCTVLVKSHYDEEINHNDVGRALDGMNGEYITGYMTFGLNRFDTKSTIFDFAITMLIDDIDDQIRAISA